jgi:hypothetical protein
MADPLSRAWTRYVAAAAQLRRDLRELSGFVTADPEHVDLTVVATEISGLIRELRYLSEHIGDVHRAPPSLEAEQATMLRLRLTSVDAYAAVAIHELERLLGGENTTPGAEWLVNLDNAIAASLAVGRGGDDPEPEVRPH